MVYPKAFHDDGERLILDVHGNYVEDALLLVRRAAEAGARVGRAAVEVVHGFSTTQSPHDRTIKNAIREEWEAGAFDRWVADIRPDDVGGKTVLWLRIGGKRHTQPLTLRDLEGN